jgi:DNA repair exonuclease SbcCD ATPase subunit
MSRAPLVFRALGVRRMPGITDGGWEVRDLSPGVNVVWGPNGAGKTTTASALQRLLWPAAGDGRAQVDARLLAEGSEWRVEMDGGTVRWQRHGADAHPVPGIPSIAERDRYRLSLHELVSETDHSLAERILHESAGGFDVARASGALGFRPRASQSRTERDALNAARARLQSAREEEAGLREDEARVGPLRREAAEHQANARRKELWERALERLDALEAERTAREALHGFPAGVARIAGNEAGQLRTLRASLADAEQRARAAALQMDEARREMDAAGLPADGLPGGVLPGLSAVLARLQELEQTRDRLTRDLQGARAECESERASVAGAVGEERVSALSLPAVDELLRFARDAEQHRAEVRAAEAERALLDSGGDALDAEKLSRGRYVLSEWLRLPADDAGVGRMRLVTLLAAVVVALAGAALGLLVHPGGWALVVAALGLAALALSAATPAADAREARRSEYARLGLDPPVTWDEPGVVALIERLEGMIAEARQQAARAERRAALDRRMAELRTTTAEVDGRRAELAARLGLAPGVDEAMLGWLCQRVHRWQLALGRARQREAELRAAAEQYAREFAELERAFGAFAAVSSPAELAGTLESLRGRRERFEGARATLRNAEQRRTEALDEAARCRTECEAILARAGLRADADARLDELCELRPAYVRAREAFVAAEQAARTAERRLAETAGFADAVAAHPRAQVQAALAASRDAWALAEAAAREVAQLEERLGAARKRTAVEDALARVQDAESALRGCRDRDEAAVLGWALREYVERETRDRDRPEVFHRARSLFAAITRGRYELQLSAESAAFRATDTETGAGCGLDELSRGTRVQLLLAVRIAFIETKESGLMLPLVLDEALGNSDDVRAEAVMDAVTELARAGRQVFFLTARQDEAQRWMDRLRAAGVPHALVDLGQARRLARFAGLPRPAARSVHLGAVPAPEDRDHTGYGALLRVPPVDVDGAGADGLHLWYLVDDPPLLHRLLVLGATAWGSLRTLLGERGTAPLGPDAAAWERLKALGHAAEHLLEALRVGRGRPVPREALERSGVITPTFRERIEQAHAQCAGRPHELLARIGALPRFRTDNVEALREFLESEGYLDGRDPLDPAAVRVRLLAAMAPELRAGIVTAMDLDRLMDLVTGSANLAAGPAAAA